MIKQAKTYQFDMNTFGAYQDCPSGNSGECYTNVFLFSDFYKQRGVDTDIILTIGGRSFDNANVFGYHFLLQDKNTKKYIDPQYRYFTFFELHRWSIEDYRKEYDEFLSKAGVTPTGDFCAWYCENFKDYVEAGSLLVRSMANYRKPTKVCINQMLQESVGYGTLPTYGECLIPDFMF